MSEVKVNKISPRSGTTVTLGDSGDTFTIPSGATINNQGTATNFGATGSASWTTTVKTNSDSGFTAVAGEGYFLDTSSGTISVNLPAGTAGAVVAFKDYLNSFDTNAVTLVQNGSDKIGGSTNNAVLTTEGIAVTLVFIDSTQGWLVTDDGLQSVVDTNPFIVATGGTITTSGNCKIHTFTGPGTFCVSKISPSSANNEVSYMVVAGGGGGGVYAGGGGAGGFRETKSPVTPYTASPLDGQPSAPNRITVTETAFPITVGGGGAAGSPSTGSPAGSTADPGSNSVFSTITAAGGGGAGQGEQTDKNGANGGSGGGASPRSGSGGASGGTGNTPPVTPPQGNPGGGAYHNPGCYQLGGGGGGATAAGATAPSTPIPGAVSGGVGGAGATTSINATPTAFAGGGGGFGDSLPGGAGGAGGGGAGGYGNGSGNGTAGTTNTGGGGGGGNPAAAAGGSGIVIIRYKFQ